MKTVFELLNHDNTISVNRRLAHALGLSEAVIYAALLAKHAWYEQHGKLSDGWFYSTVDDMEESTSLTKCQQSRCVKRLVSAGLIRCAAKGLPARRFFYIVDDPQLLEGIIGVCEPSPEENAPAVRSETSPQEVRKSDGWQAGITAAGSAESSQKTKDNKTKENKPENIKPDSAQLEAARSRINHAGLSRKYGSGFADLAAEVTAEGMAGTFTLTTDGRTLSAEEISSVFSRIDYSAVSHVADYISGKSDIRNLKAYLRSALYQGCRGAFPEARSRKARLQRAAVGRRQERGSERGYPRGTARDVRSAGKLREGLQRAALVVRGGSQAGNISPRNITAPAIFPFAGSFVGGSGTVRKFFATIRKIYLTAKCNCCIIIINI